MRALIILFLRFVRNRLRSREEIEAENLILRHQLNVLLRKAPRVRLRGTDRALFVFLYRLFPSVLNAIAIIKPDTVIRWHRDGFRLWCSRAYGSHSLDASNLLLAMVGFLPADDPRIVGTVRAIQRHLCAGPFVYRYDAMRERDGVGGPEGAFLPCS